MRAPTRGSHGLFPLVALAALGLGACVNHATGVTPDSTKHGSATGSTAALGGPPRDSALEQRVAHLELRLLERDAQIEDLQGRLDEARQEVVRAMAKLQTVASRAEAASALAEAEIALQAVRGDAGPPAPSVVQANALLRQGTAEFAKQNYGGALYLANQAKSVAGVGRTRPGGDAPSTLRSGEIPFAVPLRLQAKGRGNVRDGPGTSFKVLFTEDQGAALVAYSYVDQWVRVADETGRAGWMFQGLLERRESSER